MPPQGQTVTAEDARALADALVQGLAKVENQQEKRWLRRILSVCRAGPFRIE